MICKRYLQNLPNMEEKGNWNIEGTLNNTIKKTKLWGKIAEKEKKF